MKVNTFKIKTGQSLDNDLRAIGFNLHCKKASINPDELKSAQPRNPASKECVH